ncbi:hypothetical protein ACWDTP_36810 [Mycobacterium sp. NPDC003449]
MSHPDDGQADVPTAAAVIARRESAYARINHWRNATRDLVLTGAATAVTADREVSPGVVSLVLTATALSNDLLLADSGKVALSSRAGQADVPMRVVPMRLDILSDLPTLRVQGHDVTERMQLRLAVKLTARNVHTAALSVLTCDYDSVDLDPLSPFAVLPFEPQHWAAP